MKADKISAICRIGSKHSSPVLPDAIQHTQEFLNNGHSAIAIINQMQRLCDCISVTNMLDSHILQQPQASPVSNHNAKRTATAERATKNSIFSDQHGSLSRKNTEDNISTLQGNEASLPLTGSTLYGTPSLLRKIWMKHKKKSEYLGATNGAFEAD
ncbi:hypothetical protein JD844_016126 [Phrynosoma platyrhinos]|uniref:Vexin n=1 Tax=Phrynosoma platyrhinos TaxID=52577 RepID=A0ABQ7SK10_PHRPL|nr:hypothetical protein JD844_016126 [Phrynosoma platyrhinos]